MTLRTNDKDWLLTVATVLLIFAELAFVLLQVAFMIGLVGVLTFARGKVLANLAADGAPDGSFIAIVAMLVLAWLTLALSMLFVRHLRGVVDSVGRGDPFASANATRLTRMAWFALGVQGCQFAVGPILATYGRYASALGGDGFAPGNDASLTALALAVTLFILARVFRKGAEMRADLEGTV